MIREVGDDDDALQEFVDEQIRIDPRMRGLDVADERRWEGMVGARIRLIAELDGVVVAVACASGMPYDPESILPCGLVVEPRCRRRGVGSALFDRILAWARTQRDAPRVSIAVPHDDQYSLAWWARRGFVEEERYVVTEAPLAEVVLGDAPVIDRITFTSLAERSDLRRATYDAVDAFRRDMPGEFVAMQPFEEWIALIDEGDRPPASVILAVSDADEVVGAATVSLSKSDPEWAHVGFLGVARAWRGRGVASGLKHHQLRWCREAGYRSLKTVNHDDNASMRSINERAGFRETSVQIVLHGVAMPDQGISPGT